MQQEPRTRWALIVIIIVIIFFGIFWYSQEKKIDTPEPIPVSQAPVVHHEPSPSADDLQASVEAIIIPDYSEDL